MDAVEKRVEGQVQFWSFLGPFFILLSISVLLFKVSPHWYFPVSALIGIPLCVKWKMKGMVAALCCLFLLSGMGYQNLELDDRYWHVGLALTMAFSFIVLTLSLEEVQSVIDKVEVESQSRLDNFLLLDEKWKLSEKEWDYAIEKSRSESAALNQELARVQEDKQTFYKLAQLAKDELVQVRTQHNQLMQDLIYKKQQISQLQELLEETEKTVQDFVNSDSEKEIKKLQGCITDLEREKESLKAKITLVQTESQMGLQEKKSMMQEIEAYREKEKISQIEKQHFQDDKLKMQTLQTKCDLLEQEKQQIQQAQSKLMQQYEQVRYLEAQQQQMIQQSQSKICDLEIKLNIERQQKISNQSNKQALEEKWMLQLSENEKQMKQIEEEYRSQLLELQRCLEEERKTLKEENIQIEGRYQVALQSLSQIKEELECKQSGKHPQIEAMYLQLKEQFSEKCATLDQTRKELFHTHELLLKAQKEHEEQNVFGRSNGEKIFEDCYIELLHQYEDSQKRYESEIEDLTHLVECLLNELHQK